MFKSLIFLLGVSQVCGAVRSFDVFDTLMGRLHHHPYSVFEIVEKTAHFPGFKDLRIEAERRSNGTFEGIYEQLQRLAQLTAEKADQLKTLEFETELNQLFPIWENLNQVQDGDILVSDMYYSSSQIRKLLEHVGLNREVEIYASPDGKHSGRIWEAIKRKHEISFHFGDNPHADYGKPTQQGIATKLYKQHKLSKLESRVCNKGLPQLAHLMRALRLSNPYPPHTPSYLLWNEQAQINIPILVLASVYIDQFCKEHQKNKLLFSTRDCCLLQPIFMKMFPHYESVYFHSSRYIYRNPSLDYVSYVKSIYTEDSLIIDGFGTGESGQEFFSRWMEGVSPVYLAIVHLRERDTPGSYGIIHWYINNIEILNYDLIGTLVRYEQDRPIRLGPEYDLTPIFPAHLCMEKCVELIDLFSFPTFDREVFNMLVYEMQKPLVAKRFNGGLIEVHSDEP